MAKSLIITEKPSVAQEFARILGVSGRNDGYIENDKYVITWCVGHLVEMVYPEEYDEKYKRWRLEDLPFLPREYKYNVIPNVSRQYDVVHRMLHREDIDTVYWAGDAGKEGQTIEENIRKFGGVRAGMKELRVWIDSQTEERIQQALGTILKGRTAFVVAHRLSTIKQADNILFISNKGIAEHGTHDELMEKRGLYYRLQQQQ